MLHILINYFGVSNLEPGEIRELESIAQRIKEKRKRLDSNLTKEAREKTEKEILEIALELERKVNEFKVRAKERLKQGSTRIDSLGRFNISAQLASLVGAIFDTYQRTGEIKSIISHIWRRKHELEQEIDLLKKTFERCSRWVEGDLRKGSKLSKQTCWAIIQTLKKVYAPPYWRAAAEIIFLLLQYLEFRQDREETTLLEESYILSIKEKFQEVKEFPKLKKLKSE